MMTRIVSAILLLQVKIFAFPQDSSAHKKSSLTISAYGDLYYQYDLNKPKDKLRPPFIYNFKKHDKLNVNLALLIAKLEIKKVRANLGIMAGNYAKFNLAAEPALIRFFYEANIGYAFSDKLSVDVGILPSHIGCESAIAKDNWNLSRSLLAENSPYYQTGVRLRYQPSKKWSFSFFGLQGWQNVKDYNSSKALGTQIIFAPNDKLTFNSSSFIGNEKPDSAKQLRLFHDFHFTYAISEKLRTLFILDLGMEQNPDRSRYNKWMGTALLLQYSFAKKFNLAGRAEFYKDKNGVIISNYLPAKFETTGIALNLDHRPLKNLVIRGEIRYLHSTNNIFIRNNVPVQNSISFLTSIAFFL